MRRREVIALFGGMIAAWPSRCFGQSASALPIVGELWPRTPEPARLAAVRAGLAEGGFVEGKDFTLAMRSADGDFARLAPLATELAALNPRVIVAGANAAVTVHKVAPNVPLVFTGFGADPIALGLIESYSHPGGTATGDVLNAGGGEEALITKRINLFKELVPALSRLGMIGTPETPLFAIEQTGIKAAAAALGFEVVALPIHTIDEAAAAFASGINAGVDAFYISGGPLTYSSVDTVTALAARTGKPTVGVYPQWGRAGLLMSYGADLVDGAHRAGVYAAKILAGAKPADLPVEQASKFSFVINLKTAKALGITVPPTLLTLADEVIE